MLEHSRSSHISGVPTLGSVFQIRPPTAIQQVLAALVISKAEDKVARQRLEEKAEEREELRLKAEEYREFVLARMKKWNKMKNTGKQE